MSFIIQNAALNALKITVITSPFWLFNIAELRGIPEEAIDPRVRRFVWNQLRENPDIFDTTTQEFKYQVRLIQTPRNKAYAIGKPPWWLGTNKYYLLIPTGLSYRVDSWLEFGNPSASLVTDRFSIAHEVAHMVKNDAFKLSCAVAASFAFILAPTPLRYARNIPATTSFTAGKMVATLFATKVYQRHQEKQADLRAATHFSPLERRIVAFDFAMLGYQIEEENKRKHFPVKLFNNWIKPLFSTHPSLIKRAEYIVGMPHLSKEKFLDYITDWEDVEKQKDLT